MKPHEKQQIAGLIVVFCTFFAALAIMDYQVMHGWYDSDKQWLYRYWMGLGLVTVVFGAAISYMGYMMGMKTRYIPAVFATVILLFIAGTLDLFFYLITVLYNQPYNFAYWSAQYKWFCASGIIPEWTWNHQILWTLSCVAIIIVIWHYTLKKK